MCHYQFRFMYVQYYHASVITNHDNEMLSLPDHHNDAAAAPTKLCNFGLSYRKHVYKPN
jgi:hypothetical protein